MTRNEQYDLALEIVKLQDKINEGKIHNKQARLRCNLGKIKAISKLGMALTAIPLAGTLITFATGWKPSKLNEYDAHAVITTTIDKEGKLHEKKEYMSYIEDGTEHSYLEFYTEWEKTPEENYKREVYSYKLNDLTPDEIERIYLLNNSELNIEKIEEFLTELIIKHYPARQEYCVEIPKEDVGRKGKVQLEAKKIDPEDIKTITESIERHYFWIEMMIFGYMIAGGVELGVLLGKNFFKKRGKELNESPYYIDTKELEQQLKAKQLLLEAMPYQSLPQQQQILEQPEPQKVLKKEPERLQQQGQ